MLTLYYKYFTLSVLITKKEKQMKAIIEFYDNNNKIVDELIVIENIKENIRTTSIKKAKEHIIKYDLQNNYNIIIEE